MKQSYIKLLVTGIFYLASVASFSQTPWYVNGNGSTNPATNYVGTIDNNGLAFRTNSVLRMRLNETLNYIVNFGTSLNRDGYLLLGQNSPIVTQGNVPIYNTGAFSLLHLNGAPSTLAGGIDGLGHRDWMRTGITFTGNGDLSYIGLRAAADDVTETVVAWADDGVGSAGPDDMVFRFLGGANANAAISSNLNDPSDGDGLHIARFTPSGLIGFGNTFNATTRPQNLLHMSFLPSRVSCKALCVT